MLCHTMGHSHAMPLQFLCVHCSWLCRAVMCCAVLCLCCDTLTHINAGALHDCGPWCGTTKYSAMHGRRSSRPLRAVHCLCSAAAVVMCAMQLAALCCDVLCCAVLCYAYTHQIAAALHDCGPWRGTTKQHQQATGTEFFRSIISSVCLLAERAEDFGAGCLLVVFCLSHHGPHSCNAAAVCMCALQLAPPCCNVLCCAVPVLCCACTHANCRGIA